MLRLLLAASLAALALGCGPDDPPAEPKWEIVFEGLPGALISVWGTSATDVYAVGGDPGDGPFVLHYDGAGWTRLHTGIRGELWWVHGFAGGPIFMGGSGGQIVRYEGGTFTPMTTPGVGTVFGIWGSAPNDVWAVGGGTATGGGFVWRFDGTAWTDLPLPAGTPDAAVFKVWGNAANDVWLVGSGGLLLHWDGSSLSAHPSGTTRTIFTVHTEGERVTAVGGLVSGVVLERDPATGAFTDVTPELSPQMIGVWLTPDHGGWAVGINGSMLRRTAAGWEEHANDLGLAEALHGVWVDPEGGAWAVGGQVLGAPPLLDGVILHRGAREVAGGTYAE